MKDAIKKIITTYLESYWIPFTTFFLICILYVALTNSPPAGKKEFLYQYYTSLVMFALIALTIIGLISALIWNLIKKHWAKGILNLLLVIIAVIMSAVIYFMFMLSMFFGPSHDNFAKDFVIPPDIEMEEPIDKFEYRLITSVDKEVASLQEVLSSPENWPEEPVVEIDINVLNKFTGKWRDILVRHLATSSKWRLKKRRRGYIAARRFQSGPRRNGIIYSIRINLHTHSSDLDSKAWKRRLSSLTIATAMQGTTELKLIDSMNAGFSNSTLFIESNGAGLEISEFSKTKKRTLTSVMLSKVKEELNSLMASGDVAEKGFDRTLMPAESITQGEAEIKLIEGMQGGIYWVHAYVNPGEAGYVYLKAFEVTKNTPLSTGRLPKKSTEYTGWSDNPEEQFLYNTEITIYEGDWGDYYPARFEVWFVPSSGGEERKLIEQVFKIEGWQR